MEPGLWVPRGEHLNLPEGGKTDAGIPDPSRLTPTSGFVSSVLLAEGEGSGPFCLLRVCCTRVHWSHCHGVWGVEGGGTEYSEHSLIPVFTLQNWYERRDIKWEI